MVFAATNLARICDIHNKKNLGENSKGGPHCGKYMSRKQRSVQTENKIVQGQMSNCPSLRESVQPR